MTQQSEELAPESSPNDDSQRARILYLKSTPYDLQRAIQQRAQESVEREAQLDREQRRPKPLKWAIAFMIACVPIALTLFMVDGFLRVFHRYLDTISTQEQNQAAEEAQQLPPDTTSQSSQPGVVILQPLSPPEPAPAEQDASKTQTPDSTATPNK
jgi:hypothetical protein